MFNSSIVYELAVLKKYALPLLNEIKNTSREYSEARRLITLLKYFEDMEDTLIPNNSLLRELKLKLKNWDILVETIARFVYIQSMLILIQEID